MAQQQPGQLKNALGEVLALFLSSEGFEWLQRSAHSAAQFTAAFAAIPRKIGKGVITLSAEQEKRIRDLRPGLDIEGWTTDRLARVWLLTTLDPSDKEKYIRTIENIFPAASANELVALYSSLPVLEYPQSWALRCAEGIRSNIGDVLQAIICNNPYPSEWLNEAAWNQLVLKAFFTEKPVHAIYGLDRRANERLASTLSDYAHERWAAHRTVNPLLWRCVGKFIDKDILPDMERLFRSGTDIEQEAAALACYDSNYAPAKELLNRHGNLQSAISSGALTWDKLAEKTSSYVLQ